MTDPPATFRPFPMAMLDPPASTKWCADRKCRIYQHPETGLWHHADTGQLCFEENIETGHILQLIPAPAGMTAQHRDDGPWVPVVALALLDDCDGTQTIWPVVLDGSVMTPILVAEDGLRYQP